MTRSTLGRLLDGVAVVTLVSLALLGLGTTFDTSGYLVVALVATAVGLSLVAATLHRPLALLLSTAPVVGVVTGCLVALVAGTFGQAVPGSESIVDLMLGVSFPRQAFGVAPRNARALKADRGLCP